MIQTPWHRVTEFLAENSTDTCYEWQFGKHYSLITAASHAQIEREFGPQGGKLIGLI